MSNRIYKFGNALAIGVQCCLATAMAAEPMQLPPVDEADRDLTLVEFRQQVLQAVRARDAGQLRQAFHPQAVFALTGEMGAAALERRWQPESKDSPIWPTLEAILTGGGGFIRSERGVAFCAPYVFTEFPDHLDRHGHAAVVASQVPLKEAPSASSATIGPLSYEVVRLEAQPSAPEGSDWTQVTTLDGRQGYVQAHQLRQPTDYHACFTHEGDRWHITSLLRTP